MLYSYLFNPYSIASSVAMATTSLTHVTVLYALVFAAEGAAVAAALSLAVATYLSIYPAVLVIPVVLLLHSNGSSASIAPVGLKFLGVLSAWVGTLLFLSKTLSGDWLFVEVSWFVILEWMTCS
jgi:GPI-anchor transamidase subunit U